MHGHEPLAVMHAFSLCLLATTQDQYFILRGAAAPSVSAAGHRVSAKHTHRPDYESSNNRGSNSRMEDDGTTINGTMIDDPEQDNSGDPPGVRRLRGVNICSVAVVPCVTETGCLPSVVGSPFQLPRKGRYQAKRFSRHGNTPGSHPR